MKAVQLDLFSFRETPRKQQKKIKKYGAAEWKIIRVRETAASPSLLCDRPELAAKYWREHIATGPLFNPDVECFVVILLNTKHKIKGHHVVSIGSLNETIVHPREVYRAAVIGAAYAVVFMHNHPSGDPSPSSADINITRLLAESSKVMKVELLDHVIVGDKTHFSLREVGIL